MVGDLPLRAARCPDQSKKTNFVRFFFQTLLRYNIPIEVPLQIKRQTCLSQTLPTPFGSPGDATENRGGEAGHLMNGNTDLGGSRYWKSIGPRHSMGLEYTSTRRRNDRLRHGGLVVRGLALFEVSTGNLLEGAGIHTLTLHGTASGTAIFTYIGGGARGVNGAAVLWQSHGSCLGYIDPPPKKKRHTPTDWPPVPNRSCLGLFPAGTERAPRRQARNVGLFGPVAATLGLEPGGGEDSPLI